MQLPAILLLFVFTSGARAESRLALLIGNQAHSEKFGPLETPQNDIALVGAALEKIRFKVTRVSDVGYEAIHTALKRHIQEVRRAGKDTISFVYYIYPGRGAFDPHTQVMLTVDYGATQNVRGGTRTLPVSDGLLMCRYCWEYVLTSANLERHTIRCAVFSLKGLILGELWPVRIIP